MMSRENISDHDLAEKLEREVSTVRGVIEGTVAIDEDLAGRFAASIGGTSSFWLKRQVNYEAALARAADGVSAPDARAWISQFPVKEMSDHGWVKRPEDRHELIKSYLAFFDVNGPKEWESRYKNSISGVSFRTSPTFHSKLGAVTAWLRKGEQEASRVKVGTWNKEELVSRLPALRALSKLKSPISFIPKIQGICAEAGLAVVVLKAPTGCRASGATRFVNPSKPIVILSFRYLSDDQFWFTFFHELGHVILHGETITFVDDDDVDSQNPDSRKEDEANRFASDTLIPPDKMEKLRTLPLQKFDVIRFAVSLDIAPGIVVGQLQHQKLIGPQQMNYLKRRYTWDEINRATANL